MWFGRFELENALKSVENIYVNGLPECSITVDRITVQSVDAVEATFRYLEPEFQDSFTDVFETQQLLECLAAARKGEEAPIVGKYFGVLDVSSKSLSFNTKGNSMGGMMPIETTFDHFLLDAFTVIENGERKRQARDVTIGNAERCVLDVLRNDPDLIKQLDPRVFEVAVSAVLKDIGFKDVKLSRFSKDGGTDILAIYLEGEFERTVVVEVKRHEDNIGISVADRLFGVKHRDRRDKSLLVTSSSIARGVRESYSTHTDSMSFMDFDKLSELLQRDSSWSQTPSGLWTKSKDDPCDQTSV